jgi:hypothetical protein
MMSTKQPVLSRHLKSQTLLILAAGLVLAGCSDFRNPPSCGEYFADGDVSGYQLLDGGMALHLATGTIWYRCAAGQYFQNGMCQGEALLSDWNAARAFADEFSQLSTYQWRLPSNSEVKAISTSQCVNPALNPGVFPQLAIDNYWTTDGAALSSARKCMVYTFQGQISCREPASAQHAFMLVTRP